MKISDQRAVMAKITTRRMKIADLENEIAILQDQLNEITFAPSDGEEVGVFSSEHVIPMPTVVPEKILIGAYGMTSSYDPEEA